MHIMGRYKAKQTSDQAYKEYTLAPQQMKMSCLNKITCIKVQAYAKHAYSSIHGYKTEDFVFFCSL